MALLSREQLQNLVVRATAELQSREHESPASVATEEGEPEAAQASLDRLIAEWPIDLQLPGSSWRMLPSMASSEGGQPHLLIQEAAPEAREEAPQATGWPPRVADSTFGLARLRVANPDPDSESESGSSAPY